MRITSGFPTFVTCLLLLFVGRLEARLTAKDIPFEVPNGGKLWVLLVAGSRSFENYRHQANICHAYQLVHSHGIPDENIVVMMYDDMAYNVRNKRPGTLINRTNGTDVYQGVPKDYTGHYVTGENVLSILEGIPTANASKVFASGPNDHIFVYHSGHGAPQLLNFPNDWIFASDLIMTVKRMNENNRYSKMVFYVESCLSGSMFQDILPDDINVYAITAANTTGNSYECYYDKELGVFVGGIFSTKWLEDADCKDLNKETLEEQFQIVRNETWASQVCQFGDKSIAELPLAAFLGGTKSEKMIKSSDEDYLGCDKPVASDEVKKFMLEQEVLSAKTPEEKREARARLATYLLHVQAMHDKVHSIMESMTLDKEQINFMLGAVPAITQHSCYHDAIKAFHAHCYNLGQNVEVLRLMVAFANLCEERYDKDVIIGAIEDNCLKKQQPRIDVL